MINVSLVKYGLLSQVNGIGERWGWALLMRWNGIHWARHEVILVKVTEDGAGGGGSDFF